MLPSGQQDRVEFILNKENKDAKTHFPTKFQIHLSFCFCKSKNVLMVEGYVRVRRVLNILNSGLHGTAWVPQNGLQSVAGERKLTK